MSHKRMICIFIALCMFISFTGCLNRTPDNVKETPESENISAFVDVMIGDTSLEEWRENNVITSVSSLHK